MDLLRIDTIEMGPVYIDARAEFLLSRDGDNTNVGIVIGGMAGRDLTVAGDVDEVAAMFETNYHACRVYRIN